MLTLERLHEALYYDPGTGRWNWLIPHGRWRKIPAGIAAEIPDHRGYCYIAIDGIKYYTHRLAFFYMTGKWPTGGIDHADADASNGRWSNLRQASQSENIGNSRIRTDNTSGFKGVTWNKRRAKWQAQITVLGHHIGLGLFDTSQAAHAAYVSAAQRHFGEYARAV